MRRPRRGEPGDQGARARAAQPRGGRARPRGAGARARARARRGCVPYYYDPLSRIHSSSYYARFSDDDSHPPPRGVQPTFHNVIADPGSNDCALRVSRCDARGTGLARKASTVLTVSTTSVPRNVAGAIANGVRGRERVVVMAMGPQVSESSARRLSPPPRAPPTPLPGGGCDARAPAGRLARGQGRVLRALVPRARPARSDDRARILEERRGRLVLDAHGALRPVHADVNARGSASARTAPCRIPRRPFAAVQGKPEHGPLAAAARPPLSFPPRRPPPRPPLHPHEAIRRSK